MDSIQRFIDSLLTRMGQIFPNVLTAIIVLILGFIVAFVLKKIVIFIFKKTGLQKQIEKRIDPESFRLDRFFGSIFYYVVVVYTLLLVLDLMGVENVLNPLLDMLRTFLAFLPNVLAAGIILYAGFIFAKLAAAAVSFFSDQIVAVSESLNIKSSIDFSKVLSQVVYLFVFIPIAIVALDTLELRAISDPAISMLEELLAAIPNIIGAALILIVFFIGGKFVVGGLVKLLQGLGFDKLTEKMHLTKVVGANRSLSDIIGNVVMFFIVFAGVIAAVEKLEMTALSDVLNDLLALSGSILLGLVVFVIGNFIANMAYKSINESQNKPWVANIARFAIWGLFISIGLNTMGIGEEIVNLAFALTLGSVAVAFALAFGLGGREEAGKALGDWFSNWKEKK